MYPDKVRIQQTGIGNQGIRGSFIDTYLRGFPEENIGGMDINCHICTTHILHNLCRNIFCCGAGIGAGKNTVHIQIKFGYGTHDAVNTQRIECGINVHDTIQVLFLGIDPACQLIADILSFQLIAMGTGDNTDALQIGIAAVFRFNPVFNDLPAFIHCQTDGYNFLNHEKSLQTPQEPTSILGVSEKSKIMTISINADRFFVKNT